MLCCPMISHKNCYPFEVVVSDDPHRTSVVLVDQIKSLDWRTRQAVKKGVVSSAVPTETLSKLQTLL
ncbi:MAG: type II toxin-antitoxin system PemK/MazF family toxin [Nitrospira sp.]|nr:type II toxin-antitoxin system PemK/MazF family toxin [Nitrospira sp.]